MNDNIKPKTSINPDPRLDRHGGPWDRGCSDRYYCRRARPHYFLGSVGLSERVNEEEMTKAEVQEYMLGYEEEQERKEWR